VSIDEALLSRLTNVSTKELIKQLKELHAYGIIDYQPQKEMPQIYLVTNRAPVQHLSFNHTYYLQRKKEYQKRVDAMEAYLKLDKLCRSKYIGNYFGDTEMNACGVCDNCLQQKNSVLSTEEFQKISEQIFSHLNQQESEMNSLLQTLQGFKKEKVWKVLDFLQAEGKVVVNEKGSIKRAL
jgi:ATP-dependent DNA helicase RecQ